MFAAFLLDKLDGYYARRTGNSSPFGRRVDSFIDVFAYLVPAALLYRTVSPHVAVTWVVGFVILAFGGLRVPPPRGSARTTAAATTTARPSSTPTSWWSRTTCSRP